MPENIADAAHEIALHLHSRWSQRCNCSLQCYLRLIQHTNQKRLRFVYLFQEKEGLYG